MTYQCNTGCNQPLLVIDLIMYQEPGYKVQLPCSEPVNECHTSKHVIYTSNEHLLQFQRDFTIPPYSLTAHAMQITGGFGVGECSMEPRKRKRSKHVWGARFSCAASRVVGYGHLSEEEAGACGEANMGAGCGRRGTQGNWLLFMESLCCWLMYVKLVNSCKWSVLNSPFSGAIF